MQRTVWAVLGIEPTADTVEIRRAYAARLKLTRPDDDAQAYQTLREARDSALWWARWQDEAPDTVPPADDEGPVVSVDSPEVLPLQAPAPAAVAEPAVDLAALQQQLISALDRHWAAGGAAHVLQAWPTLQSQIADWPLGERQGLSLAMADWLLACEPTSVSPALAHAFEAQFGWLADFRVERTLGRDRAEHLRRRLERLVRQHHFARQRPSASAWSAEDEAEAQRLDAQRSQQLQPVLRLQALLAAGQRWRCLLWMVLAGAALRWVFVSAGAYDLSKVGLGEAERRRLARWFGAAIAIRVGMVLGVFQWVAQTLPGYALLAWPAVGYLVAMAALLNAGTGVSDYLLGGRWRSQRTQAWDALAPAPWKRWLPGTGAVMLAASGVLAANWPPVDTQGPVAAAWALLFIGGVVCLWPGERIAGQLAAGLVGGAVFVVSTLAPQWSLPSLWSWVALWVLMGVRVEAWHRRNFHLPARLLQLPWLPILGSLALMRTHGLTMALTPLALGAALWAAELLPPNGAALLTSWGACLLVLALAQTLALASVRWRLGLAPPSDAAP